MNKILFLSLIIISLSCNKNKDNNVTHPAPPSVKAVEISSQIVDTINRPKITFTIDVPDTSYVKGLYVYQASLFPFTVSGQLYHLTSGKVSVIDLNLIYPPAKPVKYISTFGLSDGTFILNDSFVVK
jgi:hypothetical protein